MMCEVGELGGVKIRAEAGPDRGRATTAQSGPATSSDSSDKATPPSPSITLIIRLVLFRLVVVCAAMGVTGEQRTHRTVVNVWKSNHEVREAIHRAQHHALKLPSILSALHVLQLARSHPSSFPW